MLMKSWDPFMEIEGNLFLLEPSFTQLGNIKMVQNASKMGFMQVMATTSKDLSPRLRIE